MSRVKQRVGLLIRKRNQAEQRLLKSDPLLKGSLFEQYRKCGKSGCRCEKGARHGPYPYLTVGKGKTRRLTYVAAKDLPGVKKRAEASREFAACFRNIAQLNSDIALGLNEIRRLLESIP